MSNLRTRCWCPGALGEHPAANVEGGSVHCGSTLPGLSSLRILRLSLSLTAGETLSRVRRGPLELL